MVTLLGILSALSFGIGDFLARFSSREVGFKNSLFWMLVVGALFYLILFSIFFIFISFIFYYFFNSFGLQILNFILAFILIFEVCIKIAYSDRFINWIGESLDNSIRILIMFIISLNCTYFFTRITHEIIISNTI